MTYIQEFSSFFPVTHGHDEVKDVLELVQFKMFTTGSVSYTLVKFLGIAVVFTLDRIDAYALLVKNKNVDYVHNNNNNNKINNNDNKLKWTGYIWYIFRHFLTRETTSVTICLVSFTPAPFWKGVYPANT